MTQANLILIMADQFRYDAIHAHGNPYISTPQLDQFIRQGCDFVQAYSGTPSCIPARASLMSGLKASHTGLVGYQEGANWSFPNLLGAAFADRGYYAKAIGKMHVHPARFLCGFHHVDLHDGYLHASRKHSQPVSESYEHTDDYLVWLKGQLGAHVDLTDSGQDCNSWVGHPFPYPEQYHPSHWATSRAIDFLRQRDPTRPFFLKLSYVKPHSPLDPPESYYREYFDLFKSMDPDKLFKEFVDLKSQPVQRVDALTGQLSWLDMVKMLAGYYGLVTHLDHQITRFMIHLEEAGLLEETIILFTSDHGDELAFKGRFRKGFSSQASIHVPLIVYDPGEKIMPAEARKAQVGQLVDLQDILPSLIDLATGDSLDQVDGMSFKILMEKQPIRKPQWRQSLHGEHSLGEYSSQYILALPWKYIWLTQTGAEELYHIEDDPREEINLAQDSEYQDVLKEMRKRLVEELKDRPEGFVQEGQLVPGQEQGPILAINDQHQLPKY